MINTTFNTIITDCVTPLMKEAGFKKVGLSFYKEYGDFIYLIAIQNSTSNNYSEMNFYVNCCIHSKEIDRELGIEIKNQPKEYECYYRKRIESITGLDKESFLINSETDQSKLEEALKEHLIAAVEYVTNINNLEKLIELMIAQNGLYHFQELLTFLLKTNKIDFAKKYVQRLYKDFYNDSRWPTFEKKINNILITSQSAVTMNEMIEVHYNY